MRIIEAATGFPDDGIEAVEMKNRDAPIGTQCLHGARAATPRRPYDDCQTQR